MTRVLILGAGQIGTFAAGAVARAGAYVAAADLNPAPGYFARYGPKDDVELVAADILDPASVRRLIRTRAADTVVLTAGLTARDSADDPRAAWRINVEAARTVGLVALRAGVRRLVFLSTFAVYGRPRVRRVAESVRPLPLSEYGRTKLAAEAALAGLRARGVDVRILRPCGTYGPLRLGMGSQSAKLLESLLVSAVNRVEMKLQASRADADEYVYVKDLGRAIALAALCETDSPDFVFNVGAGRGTTARELCRSIRRVVPGARLSVEEVCADEDAPPPAALDISLVRKTFGFEPEFGLVAGLTDYLHEAGLKAC